jgi:hypothetical protein
MFGLPFKRIELYEIYRYKRINATNILTVLQERHTILLKEVPALLTKHDILDHNNLYAKLVFYLLDGDEKQLKVFLDDEISGDDLQSMQKELQVLMNYGVQHPSAPPGPLVFPTEPSNLELSTPPNATSSAIKEPPVPPHSPSRLPFSVPLSSSLSGSFESPRSLSANLNLPFEKYPATRFSYSSLCGMEKWAYTPQEVKNIAKEIAATIKDPSKFYELLFLTLLYFLKRQQNLQPLVLQLQYCMKSPAISQRMLVNLLLSNSDAVLRQRITYMLGTSNPIPLNEFALESSSSPSPSLCSPLRPPSSLHFVPEAYWILDSTKLLVFSYGVGKCKGKSTLLNELFGTSFEKSNNTPFFNGTIDYQNDNMTSSGITIADGHGDISGMWKLCMAELADAVVLHTSIDIWDSSINVIRDEMSHFRYRVKAVIILVRDSAEEGFRKLSLGQLEGSSPNPFSPHKTQHTLTQ